MDDKDFNIEYPPDPSRAAAEVPDVSPEEFREGFGEDLSNVLDPDTWTTGTDLHLVYGRLADEVREALEQEKALHRKLLMILTPLAIA